MGNTFGGLGGSLPSPFGASYRLERALANDALNEERYIGLRNCGNTCYCNSLLQVLYFCPPFREQLLEYDRLRRVYWSGAAQKNHEHGSGAGHSTAAAGPAVGMVASSPNKSGNIRSPEHESQSFKLAFQTPDRGLRTIAPLHDGSMSTKRGKHHHEHSRSTLVKSAATPGDGSTPMKAREQKTSSRRKVGLEIGSSHASQSQSQSQSISHSHVRTRATTNCQNCGENGHRFARIEDNTLSRMYQYYGGDDFETEVTYFDPVRDDLLNALIALFQNIQIQSRQVGSITPAAFMTTLRRVNEQFRGRDHQDAHELFMYLVNDLAEALLKEDKTRLSRIVAAKRSLLDAHMRSNGNAAGHAQSAHGFQSRLDLGRSNNTIKSSEDCTSCTSCSSQQQPLRGQERIPPRHFKTLIHSIFGGEITSKVRCLSCEAVTQRHEEFFDLSLDIEKHTTLAQCIRGMMIPEVLRGNDKFFCESCNTYQEAQRMLCIRSLPRVLVFHLKRFKYMEVSQRFQKINSRLAFPSALDMAEFAPDAEAAPHALDFKYELSGIVVHIGMNAGHGHYIALVRSGPRWVLFDDDVVELRSEAAVNRAFGNMYHFAFTSTTGYMLFYSAVEETNK
ncbi:Ubiquitin carboxyl-terminal hydrolase 4 [Porphyridium purpureum]|uniref:Ubiquitin carboxyl-terminal hydrolase n=1 Tax=Porphyridium purpureum TaxID=35688 RepID=A0A5J4Z4I4_PORPP|nr:Ubiquitin carboxyl-terminal hydrolase 4 [Porphyridium purpureum]|eukprot:POR3847..scf295_1